MFFRLCGLFVLVALIGAMNVGGQTYLMPTNSSVQPAQLTNEVPATLEALFSEESGYLARCQLLKDLKSFLQEDEIDALLQFISSSPEEVGLTRSHFNSVADKAINAIERQKTIPPELVDALVAMFRDEGGDFTWRDYCIQHLGSIYSTEAAAGKRDQILQVWVEAMSPEARMGGTVILALLRNIGQEGVSTAYVSSKAAEIAMDDTQPDPSRLTAIQVAAELGNRDMLPLAREIINSGNTVPFRMSAMATIGILGSASDLDLLSKYVDSSDMRLRLASRAATTKIQARLKAE